MLPLKWLQSLQQTLCPKSRGTSWEKIAIKAKANKNFFTILHILFYFRLKYGEKLVESLDVQFKQEIKDLQHGLKEIKYYLYFPAGRHCDTGSYTLKAKNKYGEIETSAHLDVLLKPEIEGFKDQMSVPFKTVTFAVNIHANPKPKVIWTRGNVNCCNIDNCNVIADVEKELYTWVEIVQFIQFFFNR